MMQTTTNLAACVHRDYILNMDAGAPGVAAESVAECQRECQREDSCDVFFYYPSFFYLALRSTAKTAHTGVAKTSALAVNSVKKKKTYKVAEIKVRTEKQVWTQKGKKNIK